MEIEYSNFEVDKGIFGEKTISGLYDTRDTFIYKNLYNIRKIKPNIYLTVNIYLMLNKPSRRNYKLVNTLLKDFNIDKEKRNMKLKDLSYSDFIKVLIIKMMASSKKTIILKNIDMTLNDREVTTIFNSLRRNIKLIEKTIIYESINIESIVKNADYYVLVDDDSMIYSGDDFKKIPKKTELMQIADLANEKGANLDYYKECDDLLKAIYRSINK